MFGANTLLERGVRLVVITAGVEGAHALDRGRTLDEGPWPLASGTRSADDRHTATVQPSGCDRRSTEKGLSMDLIWFLVVIFLVFLVAGWGWRASRRH
jgi:hypothetical protein